MDVKEKTITNLKQFDIGKRTTYPAVKTRASVLVPLFVKDGELFTLMTQRSIKMKRSGGEVCFPGGKRDPSDKDDVDTALREAEEEIGLPPNRVEVVCTLNPSINLDGLLVTAVIGFIQESFSPCPNSAEVSAVFSVPLELFTNEKDLHESHSAAGLSFHYLDPDSGNHYHIWGLTAVLAAVVAARAYRKKTGLDVCSDYGDSVPSFHQNLDKTSKL